MVNQTEQSSSGARSSPSLAQELLDARRQGRLLRRVAGHLDLDHAYGVQREGRSMVTAGGELVVGHKVGLTSSAAREPLGALEPVSGYLVGSTVFSDVPTFSLAGLTNPRVEAEIAFKMATQLVGDHLNPDEVMEAASELVIALEIVSSRWSGGPGSVGLLVADNVSAAGAVLGEPFVPQADLDEIAVQVRVGQMVVHGSGSNVLGHPARSVAWLVSHLTRAGGGLEPGDLVLSGSMNTPVSVAPGDVLVADFGALGQITAAFTD